MKVGAERELGQNVRSQSLHSRAVTPALSGHVQVPLLLIHLFVYFEVKKRLSSAKRNEAPKSELSYLKPL